jgi:hypothetical protein
VKLFFRIFAFAARSAALLGALAFSLLLVDCVDTRSDESRSDAGTADAGFVPTVTVDLADERATVPPFAFGMHSSVYDNALHHPELPALLDEAGIALLRYPGGGYAEMYHWSTHSMTPGLDGDDEDTEPDVGYLGPGSDFGSYVSVIESFGGSMMITVNYGSNLQGSGPGEPKEAAAWVAYANGDPEDERVIGVDGADNDWQTVGFWAALRASEPLPAAEDDGFNHLRIAHPEPLGVEYWEIGNEVFGNGYYASTGIFAFDLHVPYAGPRDNPDDDEFVRKENPALSGTTYGRGVVSYLDEMKAVDSSIRVGAVLGTPPDDSFAPSWNEDVLEECAPVIDFAIVHWYPIPREVGRSPLAGLLAMPQSKIPIMERTLRQSIEDFGGDPDAVELVMTEVGPGIDIPRNTATEPTADRSQAVGLFAADTYLTLIEHGFKNIDWLELHNGSFLNEPRGGAPTHRKGPAFNGIHVARLLAGPGDRLVSTTSNVPTLVAHAAMRADGKIGVLLSNTEQPEGLAVTATVMLAGGSVGASGERYDYYPSPSSTAPGTPGSASDAGASDAGTEILGANGSVVGPTAFSDMPNPFTLEVPPYAVTLLVFDPN